MSVEQESHQILQYHRQSHICGKIRFYYGSMSRYATISLGENLKTHSLLLRTFVPFVCWSKQNVFNFRYLTICKYTEKFSFFEVYVKIKNKIVSFPELARVEFNQK